MSHSSFSTFQETHFGQEQKRKWQQFLFGQVHGTEYLGGSAQENYYNQQQQQQQQEEEKEEEEEEEAYYNEHSNEYQPQADNLNKPYKHHYQNEEYGLAKKHNTSIELDKETQYNQPRTREQEEQEQEENNTQLSKEAIEIFKFSEAYRKQRDALKEPEQDTFEQDWALGESTVAYKNGMEAPPTTLIFSNTTTAETPALQLQEHVLNSHYIESCTKGTLHSPIVLWPILPLRM
ncbi:hypothetical protein BDF14DRAFT_1882378 [Spinellus fusiger]|nr:hypothetical protein BDF14DRAFT_1882378 [Spinellus fusiger]